jgi:hypothetical protein
VVDVSFCIDWIERYSMCGIFILRVKNKSDVNGRFLTRLGKAAGSE